MTITEQNNMDDDRQVLSTPASEDIAWLLVVGGLVGALVTLIRGQRRFIDWAIPASIIGMGLAVLLTQRQKQIDQAEQNILAELDALDPVARAQVLKAIADEELRELNLKK